MNNTANENHDQAEELRAIFAEVENNIQENESNSEIPEQEYHTDEVIFDQASEEDSKREEKEIDILNLPPRKEIHSQTKGKFQFKISMPFVRLLIVSLVVIGILASVIWSSEIMELFNF